MKKRISFFWLIDIAVFFCYDYYGYLYKFLFCTIFLMEQLMKKALSIILSLVMILAALPLTGISSFAETGDRYITATDIALTLKAENYGKHSAAII